CCHDTGHRFRGQGPDDVVAATGRELAHLNVLLAPTLLEEMCPTVVAVLRILDPCQAPASMSGTSRGKETARDRKSTVTGSGPKGEPSAMRVLAPRTNSS